MKKWLKEYWWVLVLGVFSSSLSDEIDKITKVIYILILSVFLYIIDYFILKKIFSNTEKKMEKNSSMGNWYHNWVVFRRNSFLGVFL